MTTRELDQSEWVSYFDAFSQRFPGRSVTLELKERGTLGTPQLIARDLPLMGITAEQRGGTTRTIEILLGSSPDNHLTHVVNKPSRVSITQGDEGNDELFIIDSTSDPTVEFDFRERG